MIRMKELIQRLGLEPHPEGGFYRRTWESAVQLDSPCRSTGTSEGRGAGSSILFLLPAGVVSRWHRIDATELWQLAAGAPLQLSTWAGGSAATEVHALGPDLGSGELPQAIVDPLIWQSAQSLGEWSLAVCVVVPEFNFDGFEILPEDWRPPCQDH